MTAAETVQLLATLAAAYPRQQLSQETLEVYVHDLGDIDAGLAAAAVERVRKSSRFFPTISEIREAAAELSLDAPTPLAAWAFALARARHRSVWEDCGGCQGSGYGDEERELVCGECRGTSRVIANPLAPVHPVVQEAMDLTADSLGWREETTLSLRRAFLESYADVRRRAILGLVAPPPELSPATRGEIAAGVPMPRLGSV